MQKILSMIGLSMNPRLPPPPHFLLAKIKKTGGRTPHQPTKDKRVIREFTGTQGMEHRYITGQTILIPFSKEKSPSQGELINPRKEEDPREKSLSPANPVCYSPQSDQPPPAARVLRSTGKRPSTTDEQPKAGTGIERRGRPAKRTTLHDNLTFHGPEGLSAAIEAKSTGTKPKQRQEKEKKQQKLPLS